MELFTYLVGGYDGGIRMNIKEKCEKCEMGSEEGISHWSKFNLKFLFKV